MVEKLVGKRISEAGEERREVRVRETKERRETNAGGEKGDRKVTAVKSCRTNRTIFNAERLIKLIICAPRP